ncbi:hypothetical protein SEA_WEASELS2_236 [Rhodococcus phage Weasels2]|uniref:Uncharacterized protein n=1 Tax=Rhodococcus phage Weasels2 TaxID=1897437 RepID=A0A1I9SAK8_9CAUD|nr:hypothetical protein FDH04_gp180 [Rhodococcus phage Weasels2]AOZ63814.1 hypothetical protein SEA_WEASELS2_236 [Rhodococcus phage Weasels2]
MLVDIDLNSPQIQELRKRWAEIHEADNEPYEQYETAERLSRGIYNGYWMEHDIEYALTLGRHAFDAFPFPKADFDLDDMSEHAKYQQKIKAWSNGPRGYGMCDNPEQVVLKWPWLEWCDRNFIIQFHHSMIEDDRAYKHGEYIGDLEDPYDEPVGMFQILEIKPEYVVEIEDD